MIPGMTTDAAPEEKPPAKPLTSRDVVDRLRQRYDFAEGWITMAEVTPPGTDRRFDFLAIQSWRSRGHHDIVRQLDAKADMLRRASVQVRLAARSLRQMPGAAPPGG